MDTDNEPSHSVGQRIRAFLIGPPRDPHDPGMFHRLSLVAFFAWVGLGADGLSSSCYGPAEAFMQLGNYGHLGLLVALLTAMTIAVLVASYIQIIELFPSGGGGYLVASSLLGPRVGMVSGCALLIDYVLTISLSIASGTDAIFSFVPLHWHFLRPWAAAGGVLVLIVLNLRGVRESVLTLLPIFLLFVVTHVFAIAYVVFGNIGQVGSVLQETAREAGAARGELGILGLFAVILHSYGMGAGTYTGIEAVSNGLPILREPKVETGKRTMLYMAGSLIFMVAGLMLAYVVCGITAREGKTLNASLFEAVSRTWDSRVAAGFVTAGLISEAAILLVAAQTGFLDGPRVLANMALDRWIPNRLSMLSDRLVTQNGILLMGGAALLVMWLADASVAYLIVLYSITVFITFVLSQWSMVVHWWQVRRNGGPWKKGVAINGTGLVLTSFILVTMCVTKFSAGGWLTLLVTFLLVLFASWVRRHYDRAYQLLKRLDVLAHAAIAESEHCEAPVTPDYDPHGKTAVLLVNGFNGLGLHTFFSVTQSFERVFTNFVFVHVGIYDAGSFKGAAEIENLERHGKRELEKYVRYAQTKGFHASSYSAMGTDVVSEVVKMAPRILEAYPGSVFFGGQLVLPEDTFVARMLHNHVIFSIQQAFYRLGVPLFIMPIRA